MARARDSELSQHSSAGRTRIYQYPPDDPLAEMLMPGYFDDPPVRRLLSLYDRIYVAEHTLIVMKKTVEIVRVRLIESVVQESEASTAPAPALRRRPGRPRKDTSPAAFGVTADA